MLSIKTSHDAGYHTAQASHDYYEEGGEEPGKWLGEGADALGLTSPAVTQHELTRLYEGFHPYSGDKLVRNAGKDDRVAAQDLTFSAPKSVSVYWALAPEEKRKIVRECLDRTIQNAVIPHLEEKCATTRTGKGGVNREAAKLVAAAFTHGTSRNLDPQLHTHILVNNVGVRENGKTGSLDQSPFYKHKMELGAIFRSHLASELKQHLGLRIQQDGDSFAIKGVPNDLCEFFSTRRQEILDAMGRHGLSSAVAASYATLDTRRTKENIPPRKQLFAAWRDIAKEKFGYGDEQINEITGRARSVNKERAIGKAVDAAVERLTKEKNHFGEKDLTRFTAVYGQRFGLSYQDIKQGVTNELAASRLVSLGEKDHEERFSTTQILKNEKTLLETADRLASSLSHDVSQKRLNKVLDRYASLNDEQKRAVRHLTDANNGGLRILQGQPGTGKTSWVLAACNEAWTSQGYKVYGTSLSGVAAQNLEKESASKRLGGIESYTVRKWLYELEERPLKEDHRDRKHQPPKLNLNSRSILCIDEASMLSTTELGKLLRHAEKAKACVVLVGDKNQLQAIDHEGAFSALQNRHNTAELTDVQRQKEKADRDALRHIERGDSHRALTSYAERGRLHIERTEEGAMESLIAAYKDKGGFTRPKDTMVVASTNREVRYLNARLQEERLKSRSGLSQLFSSSIATPQGDRLTVGDRTLCSERNTLFGVENGDRATVTSINNVRREVTLRLDRTNKKVTLPLGTRKRKYEQLHLGYAATTHKMQGQTVDTALILVNGNHMFREMAYVQASRAKDETHFFTTRHEAGQELTDLAAGDKKKQALRLEDCPLALSMSKSGSQSLASTLHERPPTAAAPNRSAPAPSAQQKQQQQTHAYGYAR